MAVKRRGEDKVEAELAARVEALGGLCVKLASPGRRGCPDRLVILAGRAPMLVELKRTHGGRLSIHQRWWVARCNLLGARVYQCKNSADIDALLSP